MNNFVSQRAALICGNDPVYVPAIPGSSATDLGKPARAYVTVFANESWQKNLPDGDERKAAGFILNAFNAPVRQNPDPNRTQKMQPADWMAGLKKGHSFNASVNIKPNHQYIFHPDTNQPILAPDGRQRFNIGVMWTLGDYWWYGENSAKAIEQMVADGIKHKCHDSRMGAATIQGYIAHATQNPAITGQQLGQMMLELLEEGKNHELQRRASNNQPYVPGSTMYKNATVKQPQQTAYTTAAPKNQVLPQQIAAAVNTYVSNPTQVVTQAFNQPQAQVQNQQPQQVQQATSPQTNVPNYPAQQVVNQPAQTTVPFNPAQVVQQANTAGQEHIAY